MWALQFQISQNFTLTSFQGSAISLKRQFSPNMAIRIGASMSISSSTSESELTNMPDSFMYYTQSGFGNSQSVLITAQYLRYPDPIAGVNLFFGAGPLVSFGRTKDFRELITMVANAPISRVNVVDEVTSWSTGLSMVAGLEWFATTWISISAEYGSSLEYNWRKSTRRQELFSPSSDSESKSSLFGFRPTSVRFGVSAYF